MKFCEIGSEEIYPFKSFASCVWHRSIGSGRHSRSADRRSVMTLSKKYMIMATTRRMVHRYSRWLVVGLRGWSESSGRIFTVFRGISTDPGSYFIPVALPLFFCLLTARRSLAERREAIILERTQNSRKKNFSSSRERIDERRRSTDLPRIPPRLRK